MAIFFFFFAFGITDDWYMIIVALLSSKCYASLSRPHHSRSEAERKEKKAREAYASP